MYSPHGTCRSLLTAYGLLVLGLALYKAKEAYKEAFWNDWNSLAKVVIQDQIMYFGALVISKTASLRLG